MLSKYLNLNKNNKKINSLVEQSASQERTNKYLVIVQICLLFLAAIVGYYTISIENQISDSNEKLTNITDEHYKYHPPEVTLIKAYVSKLYVLKDNNSGTYLSILGIASIYNSALSDDIALVRQKNIGQLDKPFEYKIKILVGDKSYEGPLMPSNVVKSVEGNLFPTSVIPGNPPADVPLLTTYKTSKIMNLNKTIDFVVDTNFSVIEVIHPVNKTILTTLTSFEPTNVTYIMGSETASIKMNDSHTYTIDVRYTEDKETYRDWKRIFLSEYGTGAFIFP